MLASLAVQVPQEGCMAGSTHRRTKTKARGACFVLLFFVVIARKGIHSDRGNIYLESNGQIAITHAGKAVSFGRRAVL